jgi:hypothetical protein
MRSRSSWKLLITSARYKVELRRLENRTYRVTNYENGKDLGTVQGPVASLEVAFQKHLLLQARGE